MSQGLLICLVIISVGLVAGVPTGQEKVLHVAKPFEAADCSKPIEDTTELECRALIPRYKWSVDAKDCVSEFYGGCRATSNNFITKEECLKVAKPICNP